MIAGAFVAGSILRIAGIGSQSLWFDEGYSAWMASHSCAEIIRLVRADTAPPLYYLLLHGWTTVFGNSETALRSLSAVLSIATLAICIDMIRRVLRSPLAQTFAAWALAVSYFQVEYAQEARSYALMAFVVVATLDCMILHARTGNRWWLIPIALLLTIGLYSHNMMVPYAGALGISWLVLAVPLRDTARISPSPRTRGEGRGEGSLSFVRKSAIAVTKNAPSPQPCPRVQGEGEKRQSAAWRPPTSQRPTPQSLRRRITDIFITYTAVAALYLPWVITTLGRQTQMIHQGFWVLRPTAKDCIELLITLLGVHHFWSWDQFIPRFLAEPTVATAPLVAGLAVLVFAGYVTISTKNRDIRRQSIALLTAALLPPTLVGVYSLIGTPLLMDKIFVGSSAVLPIFAMMPIGIASGRLRKWAIFLGVLLLVLDVATLCGSIHEDIKEPWRDAAKVVENLPAKPRLFVFVATEGELPFDYYYHYRPGEGVTGVPCWFFANDPPRTMLRTQTYADLEPLKDALASGKYDEVVVLEAHLGWGDPHDLTERFLTARFPIRTEWQLRDVNVVRFQTQPTTTSSTP